MPIIGNTTMYFIYLIMFVFTRECTFTEIYHYVEISLKCQISLRRERIKNAKNGHKLYIFFCYKFHPVSVLLL